MIRAATKAEVADVAGKIGYRPSEGAKGVVLEDQGIAAAILYDRWSHNGAEVHMYSAEPGALLNRELLRAAFWYPFGQLALDVLVTVTPGDAVDSLRISSALGFKEIARVEDYWKPGVPMIIKQMRAEDCKWVWDRSTWLKARDSLKPSLDSTHLVN